MRIKGLSGSSREDQDGRKLFCQKSWLWSLGRLKLSLYYTDWWAPQILARWKTWLYILSGLWTHPVRETQEEPAQGACLRSIAHAGSQSRDLGPPAALPPATQPPGQSAGGVKRDTGGRLTGLLCHALSLRAAGASKKTILIQLRIHPAAPTHRLVES